MKNDFDDQQTKLRCKAVGLIYNMHVYYTNLHITIQCCCDISFSDSPVGLIFNMNNIY